MNPQRSGASEFHSLSPTNPDSKDDDKENKNGPVSNANPGNSKVDVGDKLRQGLQWLMKEARRENVNAFEEALAGPLLNDSPGGEDAAGFTMLL